MGDSVESDIAEVREELDLGREHTGDCAIRFRIGADCTCGFSIATQAFERIVSRLRKVEEAAAKLLGNVQSSKSSMFAFIHDSHVVALRSALQDERGKA